VLTSRALAMATVCPSRRADRRSGGVALLTVGQVVSAPTSSSAAT
jgi:hypothetical protein